MKPRPKAIYRLGTCCHQYTGEGDVLALAAKNGPPITL